MRNLDGLPKREIDETQVGTIATMLSLAGRFLGSRRFVPGTFTHCMVLKRHVPMYRSLRSITRTVPTDLINDN